MRQAGFVDRGDYLRRLGQARTLGQPAAAAGRPAGLATRSASQAHIAAAAAEAALLLDGPGGVPMQRCSNVPGGGAYGAISALRTDHGAAAKAPRAVKENFVNRVVEQCGPAVVRVEIEQKVEVPAFDNADIFSFFFGLRPDDARKKEERRVSGHGSGFCIDGAAGVILTNAHVVQGADRITVSFAGSRSDPLECEVLETDEVIDLAVIKTKERPRKPLPAVPLGHSESVRTGDWAIVLGNPFGLQNTCTLGIISSMDRSTGETGFDWMRHPLLQTDAAVNQGNSGGPLLNELGEVIGIVSMRALFGEGIGFAIPVDSAKAALPSLLQRKKVPRAFLGIKMSAHQDAPRRGAGAVVELVLPGSPAEAAGLAADDEIIEVEGKRVRAFDEVQSVVRSTQVGSRVRLKVTRGGKTLSLEVKAADIRQLREASRRGNVAVGRPGGGGGPQRRIIIVP